VLLSLKRYFLLKSLLLSFSKNSGSKIGEYKNMVRIQLGWWEGVRGKSCALKTFSQEVNNQVVLT